MNDDKTLREIKKEWHGSLSDYMIGFFSSILLTAASFILVVSKLMTGPTLVFTIVSLALVQAVIQLLFFLHVGQEPKPRWETVVFFFMILVLLIVAFGSLWIMYDLNDRVMSNM